MTEEQILKRIGELLCKAILRMDREDKILSKPAVAAMPDDEQSQEVLRLLADVGPLPPSRIRDMLKLSRSMTYRVLRHLVDDGRVISSGRTKGLLYEVPSDLVGNGGSKNLRGTASTY